MARLSVYMFPIAPDYSGAASALFDLGGITVMHDASGCTGNYTGYDEPRWLGSRTATYCSGLRRMDAILGNDEKYIQRTIRAAKDLKPSIVCFLGSPVPILIGTDLKGMAQEVESETGIPSFGFETSGQGYYDKGASDVFMALTKRFCKKRSGEGRVHEGACRVNLLGMLPLDFGKDENLEDIPAFFRKNGMEIIANYAIGLSIDQIRNAADADWNLVLSRSGLALARYMEKCFGIPYFCGVPTGDGRDYLDLFERARNKGISGVCPGVIRQDQDTYRDLKGKAVLIIHEQIFANSLRQRLEKTAPDIRVITGSLVGLEPSLSREGDLDLNLEKNLVRELNSGAYAAVLGDPELSRIIRPDGSRLFPIPYAAVSSKLHWDEYPAYIGTELTEILAAAAAEAEAAGACK